MKVTLTHDGKSVELDLTAEQMTALGLKEEKKKTGYERVEHNELCFRVFGDGSISANYENGLFNEKHYDAANYYSDVDLAHANARADRLMRQLRRFAAENGGIPSVEDWKDAPKLKFFINFDYPCAKNGPIACTAVHPSHASRRFGCIYFNDEKACKVAIDLYHDELIWYFTEYEAMLR